MICSLRVLAVGMNRQCAGTTEDSHHVLSRQLLRNNDEARRLVEGKYREYFIAQVCNVCNAQTKLADNPIARGFLIFRTPYYLINPALDEIRMTFKSKSDQESLRWEALTEEYRKWLISHHPTMDT